MSSMGDDPYGLTGRYAGVVEASQQSGSEEGGAVTKGPFVTSGASTASPSAVASQDNVPNPVSSKPKRSVSFGQASELAAAAAYGFGQAIQTIETDAGGAGGRDEGRSRMSEEVESSGHWSGTPLLRYSSGNINTTPGSSNSPYETIPSTRSPSRGSDHGAIWFGKDSGRQIQEEPQQLEKQQPQATGVAGSGSRPNTATSETKQTDSGETYAHGSKSGISLQGRESTGSGAAASTSSSLGLSALFKFGSAATAAEGTGAMVSKDNKGRRKFKRKSYNPPTSYMFDGSKLKRPSSAPGFRRSSDDEMASQGSTSKHSNSQHERSSSPSNSSAGHNEANKDGKEKGIKGFLGKLKTSSRSMIPDVFVQNASSRESLSILPNKQKKYKQKREAYQYGGITINSLLHPGLAAMQPHPSSRPFSYNPSALSHSSSPHNPHHSLPTPPTQLTPSSYYPAPGQPLDPGQNGQRQSMRNTMLTTAAWNQHQQRSSFLTLSNPTPPTTESMSPTSPSVQGEVSNDTLWPTSPFSPVSPSSNIEPPSPYESEGPESEGGPLPHPPPIQIQPRLSGSTYGSHGGDEESVRNMRAMQMEGLLHPRLLLQSNASGHSSMASLRDNVDYSRPFGGVSFSFP